MSITKNAFWQFSLSIYQYQPAQHLLLESQNQLGANVNLALFCLYLNQQKIYLSTDQLEQLSNELFSFSKSFTQALRQIRVNFKQNQSQITNYEQLRKHLLDAELILEQQEQALIVSLFQNLNEFCASSNDNLQLYQDLLACQNSVIINSTLKISDLNQYIH